MQIGKQEASQINNIENLNGNMTFQGVFTELEKNKQEAYKYLEEIEKDLQEKLTNEKISEISKIGNKVKDSINSKSQDGVLETFKEYALKLKDTTKTIEGLENTLGKLVKLGGIIGSYITLLI